jgi:predicted ATPase
MAITEIHVSNFRSFNDLRVRLSRFNVLIGRNASGKSNFVQIFKFLRDLSLYGVSDAVSLQGGAKYLANINLGATQPISVSVTSDTTYNFVRGRPRNFMGFVVRESAYRFSLTPKKRGEAFEVSDDRLRIRADVFRVESRRFPAEGQAPTVGQAEFVIANVKGRLSVESSLPEGVELPAELMSFFTEERMPRGALLLETPYQPIPIRLNRVLRDIAIYDFDPRLPKKAVPITGKAALEEDGSNLALILRTVIADRTRKRAFTNLVRDLLPFVNNVNVERFADKSLMFKIREIYAKRHYLPASLVSDGTINITALLLAMYFTSSSLTIVEEPERNIHPYLIAKLVEMMRDASRQRQLFITTHNPEIVKHVGLGNLLLIKRDPDTGWSAVTRPTESSVVRNFLQHEIGVEELYVQDLLGSLE